MPSRYIFRRQDISGPASAEVARDLSELAGVRVLDESAQSLFVQGDERLADTLAGRFAGWTITPERRIPVPDTRPRIARRAGR
jgi:hypothetical protein